MRPERNISKTLTLGRSARHGRSSSRLSSSSAATEIRHGSGAAASCVTYSAQGLMGSSNASAVRADQFQGMVDGFQCQAAESTSGGQVHRGCGEVNGNAGHRALAYAAAQLD
jgi:hypothetical protein